MSLRRIALHVLLAITPSAQAAPLDGAQAGDFSNDRFAPTRWVLDGSGVAANGETGHNILTGRTGRSGTVDRDYVHIVVPDGYMWSELRVGQQTSTGGAGGSFIGVALGATMPVDPAATGAQGLHLWAHYTNADRGTDILGAMKLNGGQAGGYLDGPIGAGDYTLWIQELAAGAYTYRFNLVLTPVPEPGAALLALAGLLALCARRACA